jgi:toxin secretion/phage lysis holin
MKNIYEGAFGAALTLMIHYMERFLFNDWAFLQFLIILVIIDTLLSVVKNWKLKTASSHGFAKLFIKAVIYGAFLAMVHGLKYYTVNGHPNAFFNWIDDLAYAAIMVREALSIVENIAAIDDRIIPKWFIKRLSQFNEDGKFIKEGTNS